MKKSREFDNVLDECLGRLLAKGETTEQCLQGFPEHTDALKPLLEMAQAIGEASAIQPTPEFREKARYQFYSALRGMERKRRHFFFSWQPRWAMALAVVLALLLTSTGTVAAASGSMPDEPLYPVKLAAEQAQLVLTPSAVGKAQLYARLTDRRVLEIVQMTNENKPAQIELAAQRLDAHLMRIAVLSSGPEMFGEVAKAPMVEEASALAEAPIPGEAPMAEKAPLLRERARPAGEARIRTEHRAKLQVFMRQRAMAQRVRLRAVLETAPGSARPALLRAIAVSEKGYDRVLESLD